MSGGLSNARLAHLRDVMAGYVDRREVLGLVALVSRRGEVHVHAIGHKSQRAWESPSPPDVSRDFWTLAYQAIDD